VDTFRLLLEGALTIRTIDTVRAGLVDALARHPAVAVDCSAATEVDVSLVQLLLAARAGHMLVLAQPLGEALRSALLRGGFLSEGQDTAGPDAGFWRGAEAGP
jgi:hypothetical protein